MARALRRAPPHLADVLGECARQVARLGARLEQGSGMPPGAARRIALEAALERLSRVAGRLALCARVAPRARGAEIGAARRDLIACGGLIALAERLAASRNGAAPSILAGIEVLERRLATLQADLSGGAR